MKIKFIIITFILNFLLIICLFILIDSLYLNNFIEKKSKEQKLINNISPYIANMHHVREFTHLKNDNIKSLLFSINKEENFDSEILFQGDSWAEANVLSAETYKYLIDISKKKKISIINGGVSSYSPSIMSSQLKYLKNNFNINPNIIIAIIDHTDFADEICRYKDRISIVDNRIIKVSGEEEKSGEIYTYRKYPEFLNSIDKYNNNFIKFFYLVKENIAYKVKANKKRCTTKTILTSLKKNNQDFLSNKLYFSKIINLYIDEVFIENKNMKLFIVIHPWEIHLNSNNNEYFYFDNLLTEIISKRTEAQNIHLIDFKKYYPNIYLDNSLKIKDIFVKNDPTSHLTPKAHQYFIKEIIEQIEKKAL